MLHAMSDTQNVSFAFWQQTIQARTDAFLDLHLPSERIAPVRLHSAMRYSTLGGGKRVRALITHATAEFCGADAAAVDFAAAAVELIHAYSLVHDDMPCMDDDDLRRRKPSCHKKYDDATALLVGDALQSLAFELLAKTPLQNSAQVLNMLKILTAAAGSLGMAGGQAIDLASVGQTLNQAQLVQMHSLKTGALIQAAGLLAGHCAETNLDANKLAAIKIYTEHIGLAFQVTDDILDAEADSATLGKTAGKDADHGKPTYVTILGLAAAKQFATLQYEAALAPLLAFGDAAGKLTQLAQFITQRPF